MNLRIWEGKSFGAEEPPRMSRRSFLRVGASAAGGLAALAAALSPLRQLTGSDLPTIQEVIQKHYKEMTPADMEKALARLADQVEKRYKVRPHIKDYKPMDGVEFAYALNLSRCIGCRRCVHACVAEKNQSRDPG